MKTVRHLSLASLATLVAALILATGCKSEPEAGTGNKTITEAGNPGDDGIKPTKGSYLGLGVRETASAALALRAEAPTTEPVPAGAEVVLEQFQIDNTVVGRVAVRDDIFQVTWGEGGKVYGITNADAVEIDPASGKATALDLAACDERLSWVHAVTWDSKRHRLLVASTWADGLLCAYDPATARWTLLGELGAWAGYMGMVYDPAADNVLVVTGSSESGNLSVSDSLKRISPVDGTPVAGSTLTFSDPVRVIKSWFRGAVQFALAQDQPDQLLVRSIFMADGGGSVFEAGALHAEIRTVALTSGAVETVFSSLEDETGKNVKPHSADGNIIILGNYDGGQVTIDVDTAIDHLKIGIVSYAPMQVTFTGAHKDKIAAVEILGIEAGSSASGISSSLVTIKSGAALPKATYSDPLGNAVIACVSGSDTGDGCNTLAQVDAYFQTTFDGVVRGFKSQYEAFAGTIKVSDLED